MVLGAWFVLMLSKKESEWLLGKLVSELVQLLLHCCLIFQGYFNIPTDTEQPLSQENKKKL